MEKSDIISWESTRIGCWSTLKIRHLSRKKGYQREKKSKATKIGLSNVFSDPTFLGFSNILIQYLTYSCIRSERNYEQKGLRQTLLLNIDLKILTIVGDIAKVSVANVTGLC
jgi:hypothetical protein